MKKFAIIFGILALTLISYAKDAETSISPYKNTRGMAMGNTYVASAIDETALLYNPAMLNVITKHKISLASVSFGLKWDKDAQDALKMYENFGTDMKSGGSFDKKTDAQKLDYLNTEFKKAMNKTMNGYVGNFTGFVVPNFGIGLFSYANVNKLTPVNPVNPQLIIDTTGVLAEAPIGIATNLGPLSLGVSARYINAIKMKENLTVTKILSADGMQDDKAVSALLGLKKYEGMSVNFGTTLNIYDLRLGLSVQDIYSQVGVWKDSPEVYPEGTPNAGHETNSGKYKTYYEGTETLLPNLRVGFAWTPSDWFMLSGDLDNLLNKDMDGIKGDDKNIYKKMHLGAELKVFDLGSFLGLIVRGGINQGYPTYGVAIKGLWIFELEYADFTEELGSVVGSKPNQVQSFAFTTRF